MNRGNEPGQYNLFKTSCVLDENFRIMPNPAFQHILKKTNAELIAFLNKLSGSALNSLLLEVFRQRVSNINVKNILNDYKKNRFVSPAAIDTISFLKTEIQLLEVAKEHGFKVMELSPLAPLGSTSGVALVDQNKIVSALRGTEVVSDATNVLALEAALDRKERKFDHTDCHYCASHRHVRAQTFSGAGFTAHFKVFCLVSEGKDQGNFLFEKNTMVKHLTLYQDLFVKIYELPRVHVVIKALQHNEEENFLAKSVIEELGGKFSKLDLSYEEVPSRDHRYYKSLRFSINFNHHESHINIGDGGFVDWAEKLTGNKKERMLTSGLGTELLFKLLNKQLK